MRCIMKHTHKYKGHNASINKRGVKIVKVTHPHHPLYGQKGRVIRARRGLHPRLTIELSDGTQARVDPRHTDFVVSTMPKSVRGAGPLLDVDGLLHIIKIINRMKCED
jgi:hypothetical protein